MASIWLQRNTAKKLTNPSTAEEALESVNWNVVEFQTLLQQAHMMKQTCEAELVNLNPKVVSPAVLRLVKGSLRAMANEPKGYLRNLFTRNE